jgi:nucleoside-diphosphate-sugar epimerase
MSLPSALIGHTGLVGSNLARQHPFDAFYNSKNIEEIAGRKFDLLIISGMPAAMWIANNNPDADRACLERLGGCLKQVKADRAVVISTIAVYPSPVGVDEESPIDSAAQTPYGRHRLMLEWLARDQFPRSLTVRLPGLFGPGLKKNAIYDLLHNNEVEKINASSLYQFYNLERLWADLSTALASGLEVCNFSTAPVSMQEVAQKAFDRDFANNPATAPARFDVRSRHAALFGGKDGYLYSRAQVLAELRVFVRREKTGEG